MAAPTLLSSIPIYYHRTPVGGDTVSYTVPTGSNKIMIAFGFLVGDPTWTYNGVAPTGGYYFGVGTRAYDSYYYWVNPPEGAHDLVVNKQGNYMVCVVSGAHQTTPVNAHNRTNGSAVTSSSIDLTPTANSDYLLLKETQTGGGTSDGSFVPGTGQTEMSDETDTDGWHHGSYKAVINSDGTETMSVSWTGSEGYDSIALAILGVASASYTATVTDTLNNSDSLAKVWGAHATVADSFAFSVSRAVVTNFSVSAFTTMTLADAVSVVKSLVIVGVSDSLNLSDLNGIQTAFQLATTDQLSPADAAAVLLVFMASASDTLRLSDSSSATSIFGISTSDRLSLLDSIRQSGWHFQDKSNNTWTFIPKTP